MSDPADSTPETDRVWRETFLARYPRKLKLGVTALILIGIVAPFFVFSSSEPASVSSREEPALSATKASIPEESKEAEAAVSPSVAAAPKGAQTESPASMAPITADADEHAPLSEAPDPGLVEHTKDGLLPMLGADGRQPWQVYARAFDSADQRPRIAIVVDGLGMSRVATDAAIRQLPPAVTLAFDVHSPSLVGWLGRARHDGHETLLTVPMEPFDYPRSDPGPNTLLSYLPQDDNRDRLLWALKQGTGYVGIETSGGLRFVAEPDRLSGVLKEMKARGLLVLDATVSRQSSIRDMAKGMHVPAASVGMQIDATPSPDAIDSALTYLEQTARINGRALGVISPLPLSLDRLSSWSRRLAARGIVLAPVSAVVE